GDQGRPAANQEEARRLRPRHAHREDALRPPNHRRGRPPPQPEPCQLEGRREALGAPVQTQSARGGETPQARPAPEVPYLWVEPFPRSGWPRLAKSRSGSPSGGRSQRGSVQPSTSCCVGRSSTPRLPPQP